MRRPAVATVAGMRRRRNPFQWVRAHPRLFDGLIVAVLVVGSVIGLVTTRNHLPKGIHPANWFSYLAVPLACVPLLWRRRRSVEALAISTLVVLIQQTAHLPDSMMNVAPVVAAYSAGVYLQSRRTLRITAGVVIGFLVVANLIGALVERKGAGVGSAIGNSIVFGTAFLAGDNIRRRRQRLADLEARATAEDTTRALLARDAVMAERQRIARELHDVVAHSLSVMVVQAGAARRTVHTKPDLAVEALGAIESTGRSALDEMRRLLGVLRADDAASVGMALAPQPSLTELSALVASDPNLRVELAVDGDPTPLPAAVDLQAYRIVQEALTNVRKHAGGHAQAWVHVRYESAALQLRIDDDGRGASAAADGDPPGHGIMGMRERAALCGGELRAGPRPGGGWSVQARLPFDRAAVVEGAA